jgi:hypothetical protein
MGVARGLFPQPPSARRPGAGSDTAMSAPATGRLARIFSFIIAKRWFVLAFYALLLPPSIHFALRVQQDNAIDRLIVPTDPDYIATREFAKVFGGGEYAILLAEADDMFSPAVLDRLDKIELAVRKVPRVEVNSALSIYRRAKAGFETTPEQSEAFRKFVAGTDLFRKQKLAGDGFLSIALIFDVKDSADRRELVGAIERAIAEVDTSPSPLRALRRIGQPYVSVHLDEGTQRSMPKSFALFAAFIVALNLGLYRSARTLIAFLLTLGTCLAVSVGYIGITGGTFTIVSPMVPMTILVTAMATLVYIQSRFVDMPEGRSVDEHQIFALTNKFLACTVSVFATLVGFGALKVSNIRPIREMGIWVAVGLLLTWVIVFTLFPALQKILRTPTQREQQVAGSSWLKLTAWIPRFSYRFRWPLVISSIVLAALGAAAVFGVPGVLSPMRLLIDPVEYISHDTTLYQDTKRVAKMSGISITDVWLKGKFGSVSEPDVLTGLHRFQQALETDPAITSAVGPTTILRVMRYLAGEGDGWPTDAEALDELAGNLEGLLPVEPSLQRFVQKGSLAQAHVAVVSLATEDESFQNLNTAILRHWQDSTTEHPALKEFELKIVGLTPLQARMSQNLVPTLVESFGLTVGIIFGAFLLVFRSGAARLMAMIPSLFAILVMFGVMRVSGMALSVTTILIASTVLGTSENDQIHFFYHFLEKRKDGTATQALEHTLRVSGRAIFFATLINAGGFLAFALSDIPPMRQFGILSALAFLLSMLADFTALPAALWLVLRETPDPVVPKHKEPESEAQG